MERITHLRNLDFKRPVSRRAVISLGAGAVGVACLARNAKTEIELGNFSLQTQTLKEALNKDIPLGMPLQLATTTSNKVEGFTMADTALPLRVPLLKHPIHLMNSHPSGQSAPEKSAPDTIIFYQSPDIFQGYFIESRDVFSGNELAVSVVFGTPYIYSETNLKNFLNTRVQMQNSEYPVNQNGIQVGETGLWYKIDRSQFKVQSLFDNLGVEWLYTPGEAFYSPFSRDVQNV